MMMVEFKLGRKMIVYLLVDCYEVEKKKKRKEKNVKKEKIEKERKKLKNLSKRITKRVLIIVLISDVCWFEIWNEEEV